VHLLFQGFYSRVYHVERVVVVVVLELELCASCRYQLLDDRTGLVVRGKEGV
jgi:hypothetical protein